MSNLNDHVLAWAQNFPEGTDIAADRKRKEMLVLRGVAALTIGSGVFLLAIAVLNSI